jgi:SAM-dependent methyltransferase
MMRASISSRAIATGLLAAAVCASARAQDEVPFIATPDPVVLAMLRAAAVGAKDFVLDLGSGDGRIVITAAKRFGARGLGVELSPQLVDTSRDNARKAGVEQRAEFRAQDLFQTDLSVATVITMYLLPEVNLQLRPALLALRPGTRLVSHDWDMGDWTPDRTLTLDVPDKAVGLEKKSRVHLWTVPAQVDGLWCGRSARLRLAQRYQVVQGDLTQGASNLALDARLEGPMLRVAARGADRLEIELRERRLQVTQATGVYAAVRGAAFEPASGGVCP